MLTILSTRSASKICCPSISSIRTPFAASLTRGWGSRSWVYRRLCSRRAGRSASGDINAPPSPRSVAASQPKKGSAHPDLRPFRTPQWVQRSRPGSPPSGSRRAPVSTQRRTPHARARPAQRSRRTTPADPPRRKSCTAPSRARRSHVRTATSRWGRDDAFDGRRLSGERTVGHQVANPDAEFGVGHGPVRVAHRRGAVSVHYSIRRAARGRRSGRGGRGRPAQGRRHRGRWR